MCIDSETLDIAWDVHRLTLSWKSIKYSPDGQWAVAGSRAGEVDVMSPQDGTNLIRRKVADAVSAIAVSADGLIAVGTGGGLNGKLDDQVQVLVYRVIQSQKGWSLDHIKTLQAGERAVRGLAFTADGDKLYSVSHESQIRSWGLPSFESLPTISLGGRIPNALEAAGSELYVATSFDSDPKVGTQIHKFADGKEIWNQDLLDRVVTDLSVSLDGSRVAASSKAGLVRVYRCRDGTEIDRIFAHTPYATAVSFASNNTDIFSSGGDAVTRKWVARDTLPPDSLRVQPQDIQGLDYTTDGRHIVTGGIDGIIRVIECDSGKVTASSPAFRPNINSVAISPDGQSIAFGRDLMTALADAKAHNALGKQNGGFIQIWHADLTEPKTVVYDDQPSRVFDLVFWDNKTLISAAHAGEGAGIKFWDVKTGDHIRQLKRKSGNAADSYWRVRVAPNRKFIAATAFGREAVVWNAETFEQVAVLRPSPEHGTIGFFGIAFSPDSRFLAIGGLSGKILKWDFRNDNVHTLAEYARPIADMDYSPDGRRIVTGGIDTNIRIWDAESGRELFISGRPGSWVWRARFSPDGNLLTAAVSGSEYASDKLLFWRVAPDVKSLPP